jgi:hypothetical protein
LSLEEGVGTKGLFANCARGVVGDITSVGVISRGVESDDILGGDDDELDVDVDVVELDPDRDLGGHIVLRYISTSSSDIKSNRISTTAASSLLNESILDRVSLRRLAPNTLSNRSIRELAWVPVAIPSRSSVPAIPEDIVAACRRVRVVSRSKYPSAVSPVVGLWVWNDDARLDSVRREREGDNG